LTRGTKKTKKTKKQKKTAVPQLNEVCQRNSLASGHFFLVPYTSINAIKILEK